MAILRAPSWTLGSWLDHRLRLDAYELRGDEIVSGRGRRPEDLIQAREIVAWQIYSEMGFDIVVIELEDGRSVCWFDKYNDLIGILQQVAGDRERPGKLA